LKIIEISLQKIFSTISKNLNFILNGVNRYSSSNYNDKDSAIIEKIADRPPRVKVTRIRKRLRTDFTDSEVDKSDNNEKNEKNEKSEKSEKNEKSLKNQYIPVIVMDKEDMNPKEEKVRRLRSDNFRNLDLNQDPMSSSATPSHFQNQRLQQQQHFKNQNKPKDFQENQSPFQPSLEFRGFVATRNDDGKVIAIPIFRDMTTSGQ